MSGHGAMCPCCVVGRVSVLVDVAQATAVAVAVGTGRFLSGRVLLRRSGPWHATWSRWAPPAPEWAWVTPGMTRPPRTTWGRRPGWHRQAVRVAALALIAAAVVVPLFTVAAAVGAVLGAAVTLAARRVGAARPEYPAPARWVPPALPAARPRPGDGVDAGAPPDVEIMDRLTRGRWAR